MIPVLLGLGSNSTYCGKQPVELLACACRELKKVLSSPVFSRIYESKAMYVENQENFYNMVVKGFVEDSADPFWLLNEIHKIENQFGRNRSKEIRFGPRPLDIDIEEFGEVSMNVEPELILPHPRIQERQFVLIPALEILNENADEIMRNKFQNYLEQLPDQGVYLCSDKTQGLFRSNLES